MNTTAKMIAVVAIVVSLLSSVENVFAKGSTVPVKTVAGPCSDQFSFSDTGYTSYYPMAHANGTVGVSMNMLTGIPRLDSVCIDTGWTITGGNVTDGIQLSFSYLGRNAIDFKYVLGKTDIKFR